MNIKCAVSNFIHFAKFHHFAYFIHMSSIHCLENLMSENPNKNLEVERDPD